MSRENVEFVEGLFAAAETMDRDALLASLPDLIEQMCDPQIEWVEDPARADGVVHKGRDGVRRSWERWLEGFDEYSLSLERVVDHGDDVLVVGREEARGARSGAPVASFTYALLTVRAGKLLRYREFSDEAAALEAVAGARPAPS